MLMPAEEAKKIGAVSWYLAPVIFLKAKGIAYDIRLLYKYCPGS
jgi:hypothetical protein